MKIQQIFEGEEEREVIILPINLIYNDFNQLFQIKDEGVNVLSENYYDASGNRIKKVTYDGVGNQSIFYFDNFVQAVNDSGTFNETYYYFNGLLVGKKDNNGKLYFYHANNLGSTSLVTNSSGDVIDDLTYEPYGRNNQSNQRYTYTGHENDNEDALLYLGARYYNPELGRFLQADPVIGNLYNSQDLNKYSYVRNNLYKYVDMDGRDAVVVNSPLNILGIPVGHSSIVIGDDLTGWTAYAYGPNPSSISRNPLQYFLGVEGKVYTGSALPGKTWQDAIQDLESKHDWATHDISNPSYFKSDSSQDLKMSQNFMSQSSQKYSLFGNNCANAVQSALSSGSYTQSFLTSSVNLINPLTNTVPVLYLPTAKGESKVSNAIYDTRSYLNSIVNSIKNKVSNWYNSLFGGKKK
jgi:RHS repeat-associated protein